MLHMICNSYFRKRWMELVVNPPGKMHIATHIDPLIVAPCVPQIAELDAKLWIQESSAEVFAFNDHLPQSMYGALVEKLKTVGTASGFGINEGRSEKKPNQPLRASKRSPAFALTVQSITSTLCTFENNLWNTYLICHCILCVSLNTHLNCYRAWMRRLLKLIRWDPT